MGKLQEVVDRKRNELMESGKYIDVLVSRIEEVGLYKNCVTKDFLSKKGDMEREVVEIDSLSQLDEESSITKTSNNGVQIVFDVKPKGKRKYIKKEFYVLYK